MSSNLKPQLSLQNIEKSYDSQGKKVQVLSNFDMDVYESEFISIFGPNGCGKSTLLHLIAGIIDSDEGTISIKSNAEDVISIGIVFQNYDKSLLPWRTCLDNIGLPLEAENRFSKKERRKRSFKILEELDIDLPLDSYPYQMSGGQKQLTCIARAMIRRPSILLLDEPFASLDYQTRISMQEILQDIWGKTNVTTIFISHEIDEAIYLADRVLLLTSRPATVASWYEVPLSRPRKLEMLSAEPYVKLRTDVLNRFRSEVGK
ncbi:MAG: ABC transporter ATP-binding protein [Candidatus Electryonea clarkiae]|nr:ABC transporter ATP-binding protein [Candidatus Electryonea clarkiae]